MVSRREIEEHQLNSLEIEPSDSFLSSFHTEIACHFDALAISPRLHPELDFQEREIRLGRSGIQAYLTGLIARQTDGHHQTLAIVIRGLDDELITGCNDLIEYQTQSESDDGPIYRIPVELKNRAAAFLAVMAERHSLSPKRLHAAV